MRKSFALKERIAPGWYGVRYDQCRTWRRLETANFEVVVSLGYAYAKVTRINADLFRSIVGKDAGRLRLKEIDVERVINSTIARSAIERYPGSKQSGSFTYKDILELLSKQGFKCNGCDDNINCNFSIDHIYPVSRGGSNHLDNIQLLCKPCNSSKCDRTMSEWVTDSDRCARKWGNGARMIPQGRRFDDNTTKIQETFFPMALWLRKHDPLASPLLRRQIEKRGTPPTDADLIDLGYPVDKFGLPIDDPSGYTKQMKAWWDEVGPIKEAEELRVRKVMWDKLDDIGKQKFAKMDPYK